MDSIKFFIILYFLSTILLFILKKRGKPPFLIPGDLYRTFGNIQVYVPLASSFIISIISFALLNKFIK